jgi:predicted tellurium resistance membrane protein TerC
MMARFKYLQHALAVILVFIGAKLVFHHWVAAHVPQHVAIGGSMVFILTAMAFGIGWSWKKSRETALS